MSSRAVKALSLILLFTVPASLMLAETRAAMVFATGTASLNGTVLSRSTAVFAGDVLETSRDSAVVINTNGSSIRVGGTSKVQFQGESIDLASGVTQVSTRNGMKTQADNLSVTPTDLIAKYQVTRAPGKVMVTALTGSVSVVTGTSSQVVAAGESKSFGDDQEEEKEKRKKDRVGAVVFTSDKTMFLWAAGALAAGGAIAYLALRDGRQPLSNQLP